MILVPAWLASQPVPKAWWKCCVKCKMKDSHFKLALVGSTLERWNIPTVSAFQFRRLKIELKIKWRLFAIRANFKTPHSNREMRASLLRGSRRPTYFACIARLAVQYTSLLHASLVSENSNFFTWLFTKMALSVLGGWEAGQELTGSPFVLKNAWICLTTSFSFVGNNLALQIRSFGENHRKCNRTCDPTDGPISPVSMK